jgi:hypothetical protein
VCFKGGEYTQKPSLQFSLCWRITYLFWQTARSILISVLPNISLSKLANPCQYWIVGRVPRSHQLVNPGVVLFIWTTMTDCLWEMIKIHFMEHELIGVLGVLVTWYSFWVILEFELKILCLLDRCSITWAMPPVFIIFFLALSVYLCTYLFLGRASHFFTQDWPQMMILLSPPPV